MFSNVVHVGDIRPLLRVGVDAHIYQVPQLVGGGGGWFGGKKRKQTVSGGVAGLTCGFLKEQLRKCLKLFNERFPNKVTRRGNRAETKMQGWVRALIIYWSAAFTHTCTHARTHARSCHLETALRLETG